MRCNASDGEFRDEEQPPL